jgi:hypothetical protein
VVRRRWHWISRGLVAAVLRTWLTSSLLLAPVTTFAAPTHRDNQNSCGQSGGTRGTVVMPTAGASIRLNQIVGLVGDSLVISGAGWPGNTAITIDAYGDDGQGRLVLGQSALVKAATDSAGAFHTAPFEAPTYSTCGIGADYGQPGSFVLFRAHTRDNTVSAQVRFLYQLSPGLIAATVSDNAVVPGSTIPITGEGWEAGEWVTVTTGVTHGQSQAELENGTMLSSEGTAIRVKADGRGEFTTPLVVPSDLTPQTALVVGASATGPIYGSISAIPLVLNVLPTMAPTFSANLTQGSPGSQVTLSGAHWLPGSILAEYCRGQMTGNPLGATWPYPIMQLDCNPVVSQQLGVVPVKGESFRVTVTIPQNARPGPITIQVRAQSDILPAIYVLATPFTVLATWQIIHPRLAQALGVTEVVVPLLLLVGGGVGAMVIWRRRRRVQMRQTS